MWGGGGGWLKMKDTSQEITAGTTGRLNMFYEEHQTVLVCEGLHLLSTFTLNYDDVTCCQ